MFPSGFLSTSDGADYNTRYIAPLPISLDCHHDPSSSLSYWFADKNMSLTVQWENAVLKDIPLKAPFTFRVKLWKSGLIEFMYKEIGISPEYIESWDPKIKTGISDSITTYNLTYRYHLVEIPIKYIKVNSIITIRPITGKCIDMKNCNDCAATFNSLKHDCYWCPDIQKCLSGMDFHKPKYFKVRCSSAERKNVCKSSTTKVTSNPSTEGEDTEEIQLETKNKYYNATVIRNKEKAMKLWVDMSKNSYNALIHGAPYPLYNNYKSIQLTFPFTFFGDTKTTILLKKHLGEIILIKAWETKIFSDRILIWNSLQEYFWTEKVLVEYKTTFNSLTIQWTIGSNSNNYCYQATLHSGGNIDFVYKKVNKSAMNFLGLFRSSIKELNINVAHAEDYLEDWTAIRFFAAPTCANLTNCVDCITSPGCRWCQLANKCTDKNTRDDDWTVR